MRKKTVSKSVFVEGEVIFENLYNKVKRGAGDGSDVYDMTIKIKKDSKSAKKLRKSFVELVRQTKPVKIVDEVDEKGKMKKVKKDVKTSASFFWESKVKDGDEDEYWSGGEYGQYNQGYLILQPYSKNSVPVWKYANKKVYKTDLKNYVSWGDKVKVLVTWTMGHFKGDYVTLYLNGITVLEKNTNTGGMNEDKLANSFAKELDAEVEEETSMDDLADEKPAKAKKTKKPAKKLEPEEKDKTEKDEDNDFDDINFDEVDDESDEDDDDDLF